MRNGAVFVTRNEIVKRAKRVRFYRSVIKSNLIQWQKIPSYATKMTHKNSNSISIKFMDLLLTVVICHNRPINKEIGSYVSGTFTSLNLEIQWNLNLLDLLTHPLLGFIYFHWFLSFDIATTFNTFAFLGFIKTRQIILNNARCFVHWKCIQTHRTENAIW